MSRVSAVGALPFESMAESIRVCIGVNEAWWWRLGPRHNRGETCISILPAWTYVVCEDLVVAA